LYGCYHLFIGLASERVKPKIRDEILEDATALGGMGFSPILGSATVAGSPATGSEGDFLSSGLAILKV
jgi:hypothetical protein